jgi:hypothetical protein
MFYCTIFHILSASMEPALAYCTDKYGVGMATVLITNEPADGDSNASRSDSAGALSIEGRQVS